MTKQEALEELKRYHIDDVVDTIVALTFCATSRDGDSDHWCMAALDGDDNVTHWQLIDYEVDKFDTLDAFLEAL